MPRPSISPEKRAEMRSAIRAAAIRVIRRKNIAAGDIKGLEQVTIRDVIKEADISIGTFYKYFNNRTELGQALWAEPVEQLKTDMAADLDGVDNPETQIRILLGHYIRFSVENRRIFKGAFLHVRPDDQPKPPKTALDTEYFFLKLREAIKAGQAAGAFKPSDPHVTAQILWASIHGALALPENLDRYRFDEDLAEHMVEALLGMLRNT